MIVSFRCKDTQRLFERKAIRRLPSDIQRRALRVLLQLHAATELKTMAVPPGNRLEALSGDRAGQHSVRVNRQYRLCFVWQDGHAHDVEIVDYH